MYLAIPSESVVGNNQLHLYFECESEEESEVNEGEGTHRDLKAREMHEKSSQDNNDSNDDDYRLRK